MGEFIVVIRRNSVLQTYTVLDIDTLIDAVHHSLRAMSIKQLEKVEEIRAISIDDMIDVDFEKAIKHSFNLT